MKMNISVVAWRLRVAHRSRGLSLCTHPSMCVWSATLICGGCGSTMQELDVEGLL